MLIDVWSPINLTLWVNKDMSSLLGFVGFIILAGTILGLIIDGIHHSIIEDDVFEHLSGLKEINESLGALFPDANLGHTYFFKMIGDKAKELSEYLISATYRYSEFYANTFISLIPFSLVEPFYLFQVLQIPWTLSIFLAILSLGIACVCLNSSYVALKEYQRAKFSLICGYLVSGESIIHLLTPNNQKTFKLNEKIELEARIIDKTFNPCLRRGIQVSFKTTLGEILSQNTVETNGFGVAKISLRSDRSGTALVTASSNNCIPGVTYVHFR